VPTGSVSATNGTVKTSLDCEQELKIIAKKSKQKYVSFLVGVSETK